MRKRTAALWIIAILLYSLLIGGCGEGSGTVSNVSMDLSTIESSSEGPYTVLNDNQPSFQEADFTEEAFEIYSDLDALGRCQTAFANICKELMPVEERGAIGSVKPTGWHTVKYDIVDGKYLYNRCHLIGYQLAGENANEKNLITGTRYMNVEGMLPFENMVAEFVEETDYHVLYRVTPVFEGNNLVASGVEMEAESVEDNGAGICFHVFVPNIQPGITIDYATGESGLTEEYNETQESNEAEALQNEESNEAEALQNEESNEAEALQNENSNEVEALQNEESNEAKALQNEDNNEAEVLQNEDNHEVGTYILNTNTKKFHLPGCSSVEDMKESNKEEFTGSREEVLQKGYEPCKRCNP